jgi:hypothetical protein
MRLYKIYYNSRFGYCICRYLQPPRELSASQLSFSCTPISKGIDHGKQFVETRVLKSRLRDILVQGNEAVHANLSVRVRPHNRQVADVRYGIPKWRSCVACWNASGRRADFSGEGVADPMEEEF